MPAKGNLMINAHKLKLFEINPMILLPLLNVASRLPEAPSDAEKVYVYEGKKYGQPKFRIKTRPATNISPASDEFLFDKDEQTGKITLRSIIEVYRNEPDVYPLPIKNATVTLEFDSGNKKVKKEMAVTASPLMDSVNVLQDLHVQAEIQLDEIKDLLTDLKDPVKIASFQLTVKSELWYQVPKSTGFILNPILINPAIIMHTIVTTPKEDPPVLRDKPYIFRRRRIIPTPTPIPAATGSNTVEFTDPQKLDLTSIVINSYTKDDTAVFGPLSDQFEVKDLNWQIVNILKTGVNYTIAYRPTARTDVFYFLPQAFRIKAKEQSGEPKIAINMTAGADDKPELYKINIAITLIPYYNALAKKDLYLELNKITNGLTKFCELRLGGYKSVKFELRPAYAGASAIFTGKIPEAIAVIDPVNGFTLNVECSLESFDYFKREITENEGVIIGDIVFELISGKEGAEQVSEQRIPVELNMRKLAGIPVQVDPDIEQLEDQVNIKGFTVFNQNTFPITVGGVDLTLLSDIENTIYDADYDIKVQNATAISLASAAAQQVLLDSQSIDNDEERLWTQLVCEPYSVNINSDPGAILDRVIDYATGDPQVWNLEISCPLLERWSDLDEATLAPYKQISNVMVEIKNEQGAVFSVKLDKTKPVAKLGMARSITEILKSQQLSGRKYQYRVGTAYIIDPTYWTDWKDPESTASDYLSIIPQKLSVQ